jgi:hypothetical protein
MVAAVGKYLDIIRRAEECAKSAVSAVSPIKSGTDERAATYAKTFSAFGAFRAVLTTLETRCPELVPAARWQQAVADGRTFLARWGTQAERLGWTSKDLFGLFPVPENPHPSFSRLSRYEHTGLIWLLHGCPVIALTEATAAIQHPSGAITIYPKHNKPALGPTGDSLDDLE